MVDFHGDSDQRQSIVVGSSFTWFWVARPIDVLGRVGCWVLSFEVRFGCFHSQVEGFLTIMDPIMVFFVVGYGSRGLVVFWVVSGTMKVGVRASASFFLCPAMELESLVLFRGSACFQIIGEGLSAVAAALVAQSPTI